MNMVDKVRVLYTRTVFYVISRDCVMKCCFNLMNKECKKYKKVLTYIKKMNML